MREYDSRELNVFYEEKEYKFLTIFGRSRLEMIAWYLDRFRITVTQSLRKRIHVQSQITPNTNNYDQP